MVLPLCIGHLDLRTPLFVSPTAPSCNISNYCNPWILIDSTLPLNLRGRAGAAGCEHASGAKPWRLRILRTQKSACHDCTPVAIPHKLRGQCHEFVTELPYQLLHPCNTPLLHPCNRASSCVCVGLMCVLIIPSQCLYVSMLGFRICALLLSILKGLMEQSLSQSKAACSRERWD